jgi:1-acyl-sn-glycerol-3-phosphate acyltransferase
MYSLVQHTSRITLRTFFQLKVAFDERIPSTGPMVVVANHESFLDAFVVGAALDRRATFLTAPYLFSRPVVGSFLRAMGAIPVYNHGDDVASLRGAIRLLQAGGTVVVFPAGGISSTQVFGGAIFLAIKAEAPLVPMRIMGTKKALPPGHKWPSLLSPITVSVGTPIPPSELCAPGVPTGVAIAQGRRLLTELLAREQ